MRVESKPGFTHAHIMMYFLASMFTRFLYGVTIM